MTVLGMAGYGVSMKMRIVFGLAAVAAVSGAVLWAYGLTVLQPLAETEGSAFNNTYWARDMRWSVILAVLGILLAFSRDAWRRPAFVFVAGGTWLGADLVLDRAGLVWFIPAAIGAGLVVMVTLIGVPERILRTSTLEVNDVAGRRVLTALAAMCAATAPFVAMLESPTDAEPQLVPTRVAASILLVAAALACALAASPALAITSIFMSVVVGTAASVAFLFSRGNAAAGMAVGSGLLVAAWTLSRAWPGWAQVGRVAFMSLIAYPVVATMLFFVQMILPLGKLFTALSANPAVISADSDILYVLVGMTTGLIFVGASRLADRLKPTPAYLPASG